MVGAPRTTKNLTVTALAAIASLASFACGVMLPPTEGGDGDDGERPSLDRPAGREATTDSATVPAPSPSAASSSGGGQGAPAAAAREYAVFVSSAHFSAVELGGLAGADARCAQLANDGVAALHGKKWVAWLSDVITSARDRLGATPGPWVLVDGRRVATNVDQLTGSNPLDTAIAVDELGTSHDGDVVWTGTLASGAGDTTRTCEAWFGEKGRGRIGTIVATKPDWTAQSDIECGGDEWSSGISFGGKGSSEERPELRIYCFETD